MLVGVLVTVLVQSSSTSTSIFITMVAADLLTVKQAISLIMGANVGTSVTSTIVALGQSGNRNEFRRAFAAATVHDMFNFLNVLVLLPLEIITGYLYALSKAIVDSTPGLQPGEKPPDILKKLTKPFTSKIIAIDKKLITKIAEGTVDSDDDSVPMIKHIFGDKSYSENGKDDVLIGWIVLIISLAILCICLYTIVYLLKSILKGHIALWLHKGVNGQVPDIKCGETITIPMGWASGYLAMAVGLGLTICVQSSSITTSALTPLVGIGVITIERMYPVVLGANIGTCITGVLAALAASSSKLTLTLQVAYAHLFFNVTGIAIWYGIWPMRQFPIRAAKFMGNTTAEYRWFALAYLAFAFLIIPAIFMGIAFGGPGAIIPVVVLCVLAGLFVAIVNTMQFRCPERLPAKLRDWLWLPEPLRSLRPYDRYIFAPLGAQLGKCCKCCKQDDAVPLKDLKGQAKEQAASTDELAKAAERMA
jgi:solute carrier family 34 (sodium-dependent phosphate cotransporter)